MSPVKEEELKNILPVNGPSVQEVKKYIDKYHNEKIVIKCGGSVLIDPNLFNLFISDVSTIKRLGITPIIVHGGGKRINEKLKKLNIESTFIKGLRVTNKDIIKVVEDVLVDFNKEIVNALKRNACDAKSITTRENNIIFVKPERKELEFVGIPAEIKINALDEIIKKKIVPIIAPLGLMNNQVYNINADVCSGSLAKDLQSRRLLLVTDVEGVLDKNKNLISEINSSVAEKMLSEGDISGGMIPKINTCLDAINNGVTAVVIVDGRKSHSILFELFSDKGAGTLIRK